MGRRFESFSAQFSVSCSARQPAEKDSNAPQGVQSESFSAQFFPLAVRGQGLKPLSRLSRVHPVGYSEPTMMLKNLKSNRLIITPLAVTSIFTSLFFLLFNFAAAEPFRVGISIPLTGDTQAYGEDIRRGYEIGKEILKADDIELIFENDACNATKSISVAKKLVDIDKVQVITGIFCNTALFAAAPIFNRANIPVLTCGANPGDKKGIGKRIFRLWPADHLGVATLVKFISKNGKRLCMLTETEAYTELISRTFKSEWKNLGAGYELYAEDVGVGEKDFRSVLLRLKQRKCAGLFINTAGDDGYIAAHRQAKDLEVADEIFAYYMPGSSVVQQALGQSLEGVVYATLPSREEIATETGQTFQKLYSQRFGEFQVAVPVALLAFETLRVIVEARKANIPLDEFLRNRAIKDGAIGEYSFDDDGALQGVRFKIVRYQEGREQEIFP